MLLLKISEISKIWLFGVGRFSSTQNGLSANQSAFQEEMEDHWAKRERWKDGASDDNGDQHSDPQRFQLFLHADHWSHENPLTHDTRTCNRSTALYRLDPFLPTNLCCVSYVVDMRMDAAIAKLKHRADG